MRRLLALGVGLGMLLAAFGGIGAAGAQTAGVQGTLYRSGGGIFGTVSVGTDGSGNTVLTLYVTGGAPSTPYTVCLTDPASQQLTGACSPSSGLFGVGVVANPYSCPSLIFGVPCSTTSTNTLGSFVTDQQGHATATATVAGTLSVAVIAVWNTTNPSDSAQAVVNTGLAGTGLVGTGAGFGFGYGGFTCPTFNGVTC